MPIQGTVDPRGTRILKRRIPEADPYAQRDPTVIRQPSVTCDTRVVVLMYYNESRELFTYWRDHKDASDGPQ